MKRKICEIVAFILCLTLLIGSLYYAGYMLLPERTNFGSTWTMYTKEPEESVDVIFLGSSMVYCDVVPAQIYEDTGVSSYVVAGGSLTASLEYYYLKEALKTQTPDAVMIEATSAFFQKYESFTNANVGYMPWGINRLEATFNAAESEKRLGLLFPLFNYHDRWENYDLGYFFKARPDAKIDINAGYTYLTKISPQDNRVEREVNISEADLEHNLTYLEKTVELCREKGIQVQLFLSPTSWYLSEEHVGILKERFPDIALTDFSDYMGEIGIDPAVDFYDKNHLNFTGACKFSSFLAKHIGSNFNINQREHSKELWQERVDNLNTLKEQ